MNKALTSARDHENTISNIANCIYIHPCHNAGTKIIARYMNVTEENFGHLFTIEYGKFCIT